MNKYWFKKTSKGIPTPITWQGWLSFVLVVLAITQIKNFVSNIFGIFVIAVVIFYAYQQIVKRKTAPDTDIYDPAKDSQNLSAKQVILIVLGLILFFVVIIWLGFKKVDSQKPQTQQAYEAIILAKCVDEQKWAEEQALRDIEVCGKDIQCVDTESKRYQTIKSKDFIPTCLQTIVLNDEMADGAIKGFAEQTQYSVFAQDAKSLTDSELVSEIDKGASTLINAQNYDTNLGLQMSAYIRESLRRNIDKETTDKINKYLDSMLTKWSPCWGIPYGQCRE